MMMARPFVVALLCVALWCGVVFAQDEDTVPDADTDAATADAPSDPPKPATNATTSTTTTTTTTTEGTNAADGDEASPSKDDQNGAATLSVSLSSLMLATVLAKVYAH